MRQEKNDLSISELQRALVAPVDALIPFFTCSVKNRSGVMNRLEDLNMIWQLMKIEPIYTKSGRQSYRPGIGPYTLKANGQKRPRYGFMDDNDHARIIKKFGQVSYLALKEALSVYLQETCPATEEEYNSAVEELETKSFLIKQIENSGKTFPQAREDKERLRVLIQETLRTLSAQATNGVNHEGDSYESIQAQVREQVRSLNGLIDKYNQSCRLLHLYDKLNS